MIPPPPMNQPCTNLRSATAGTWRTVPGLGLLRLCSACTRELDARFDELQRVATPIEQYARKQEIAMQKGCTFQTRKVPIAFCRKACDPGQELCPRHIYLAQVAQEATHQKELAKPSRKGRAA